MNNENDQIIEQLPKRSMKDTVIDMNMIPVNREVNKNDIEQFVESRKAADKVWYDGHVKNMDEKGNIKETGKTKEGIKA